MPTKKTPENSNNLQWVYVPDHPNAYSNGYYYKHRLVVEKYLKRYLHDDEIVVHKDGDKDNNKIGNLLLFKLNEEGEMIPEEMKPGKGGGNMVTEESEAEETPKVASYRVLRCSRIVEF